MHDDGNRTRLRRSSRSPHPPDGRREARLELELDARRPLGSLRPRSPARRPLSALEGPWPDCVLRGPRCQVEPAGRGARRLQQLRIDARSPPRPPPRPGSRDRERLARPPPADRCRRRAHRAPHVRPRRRRRARRGLQLGSRPVRGPRKNRDAHDRRHRQRERDPRLARRRRGEILARGLAHPAPRRARPRRDRARTPRARRSALRRRGGAGLMRERFYQLATEALWENDRVAVVLAAIGAANIAEHPRRFDVGIREQLMIGVAAGLALEGYRPIVHSYTPFLVERPYESLKLDLGHNDLGAVLVSYGASYDASTEGRTHQAPEDVAAVAALPGWTIEERGHVDEMERMLTRALARDDRVCIRLTDDTNRQSQDIDGLTVLRRGNDDAPFVLAVGPTLDEVLEATADTGETVAYLATVRPFDADGLRKALRGTDVVLVEPYLRASSAAEISAALVDRPHRLLSLGVPLAEFRRYGTGAEHRAAHGLDARGIRAALAAFRSV